MTRFYIIRHAEAEGNLYRRIHGWYDSLVTENGLRQIEALERRFREVAVDAVYASDLFRTRATARAVYVPKGLPLHTRADLREVNMGRWEDRPWGEIAQTDGERLRLFNATDCRWRAPEGESLREVGGRLERALYQLARLHPDQTVAVFSHGTAIRSLQCRLKGLELEEWKKQGHSDNTAVTCVEVEGERGEIVFENDSSHLSGELSTLARQRWWRSDAGSLEDVNLWYRRLDMEKEAELYRIVRRGVWQELYGRSVPFDEEGFLSQATRRWRLDRRAVTCAMWEDRPVGLLELDLETGREEGAGHIAFLCVLPEFRGQGLGVQLLGEAVSVLRSLGREKLRLCCAKDNLAARHFYKKYGFCPVGEKPGARGMLDLLEKRIGREEGDRA